VAYAESRPLHNIYALPPVETPEEREAFEERLTQVMSKPTSPYDSHPAVSDRIRLLQPLADRHEASGNQAPAWELFEKLDALQSEMTALVEKNVVRQQAAKRAARASFHRALALRSVPEVRPYQEALAMAIESGDLAVEAEALQDLGGIYAERGVHAEALIYYTLAVACCVERKDREGERVARFNLAEVHKTMKDYAEAEEQLRQVVALDEAVDSPDLEADRGELREMQRLRGAA
jgi:tetratricopeptide (TPR) repeat protein